MEYARKHKTVKAMQLTKNNLNEVWNWSDGKVQARLTGKNQPAIEVFSPTSSRKFFSHENWWLVLPPDGDFMMMVPGQFEEEYEAIH